MKNNKRKRITLSDFGFQHAGYGAYNVTYYSPLTNRMWTKRVTDMTIIDETKNCDEPKVKDLDRLKRICKS